MRTPLTRSLLALAPAAAFLALAACNFDRTPLMLSETGTRKIPPEFYRRKIVEWANRYYAEPASVRFLALTDPVRVRESAGKEAWFVCVELDARARGGLYMGPRRIAIGIGERGISAPMERSGYDFRNEDCDAPQLAWRPWSGPRRS
jgi:hypothetical protein